MKFRKAIGMDACLILVLMAALLLPATASANPYSQGRLAFARGDFDSAMRLLEQSTRSDPSNGNAHFYIGLIHERKGRKGQSIQAYKQAVARRMDADLREKALWKIVLYSKYIGDWGAVSIYSGQFLKYKHHPEMARLQSMAANQGGSSSAEMVRLVQKGQRAEKEGNLAEAIGYYEEAIDIEPDAHSVRWNLASVAMKANQYSRAVSHLQYLDKKDSQWKYSYKLGVCYYQLGKYQNALSSFDRATAQNKRPSGSFRYFIQIGRGLTYLELEDVPRAEEQLAGAAKVKNSALVKGALSRLALMKGDRPGAISNMQAALKEDGQQLDALSVKALLSSDPGDYEKFQDQLYRNTVYQPAYYNSVTLQYVHVLIARSRFDRARTVLDSISSKELESIHGMKFDTAAQSNRALILSTTLAPAPGRGKNSRTELIEEEIQMFLIFDKSDRARSAVEAYKDELALNNPQNTDSQIQPKPTEEPESPAGWLRQNPDRFESIARIELLDYLLKKKQLARALEIASYWIPKSESFKVQASELNEVQSLVSKNEKWANLFGKTLEPEPQDSNPGSDPELKENDSTVDGNSNESTVDLQEENSIPENPQIGEAPAESEEIPETRPQ